MTPGFFIWLQRNEKKFTEKKMVKWFYCYRVVFRPACCKIFPHVAKDSDMPD